MTLTILIYVVYGVYEYYPITSYRQVGLCDERTVMKVSK